MTTAPTSAASERMPNEVLKIRALVARSSIASYSATNLPTAVCKPRSSKPTYALICMIRTQALYSAVDMRWTRKGGSSKETSSDSITRNMFDTEPCSILRLWDMGGRTLFPQNDHETGFLKHRESQFLKSFHHRVVPPRSHEPGMGLHDDSIGISQNIRLVRDQIAL